LPIYTAASIASGEAQLAETAKPFFTHKTKNDDQNSAIVW
jgi:hypothetical protein